MAARSASGPTYLVETLGCKANHYDSRRLAEALESLGCREAVDGEAPEICLVNTCTVTAVADRKSRQKVGRLRRAYPEARLFVTGCYASAAPQELADLPGVDGVFGRRQWGALLTAVNGNVTLAVRAPAGEFGISSFGGRARAFLKIQEGCDAFCAYCILPYVRGRPVSRPLADVRAEAGRLAAAGFAELVLTGIHLGLYGRDLAEGPTLADAVRAVAGAPGVARVRLSSVEAGEVDEALLEAMAHPAVCAHLHLPLQSGDAGVLRRMNRPYSPEEFLATVDAARRRLDRPAVTTDVMVGFPGETDAEFESTLSLCRAARFSRTHVFPFSPRPGTRAADMPGRVPAGAIHARSRLVRQQANAQAAEWAEGFVGGRERVLFERCAGRGRLVGYTDRYVRFTAPGGPEMVGRTAQVLCQARRGASLAGRCAGEPSASG